MRSRIALGPGQLGIRSVGTARWLHRSTIEQPAGTMIGCDDRVMSPHGYPRLIDPSSGAVITEWPGVAVPAKSGS